MNLIMEKTVKPKPETAEKRIAAYDRLLTERENEKRVDFLFSGTVSAWRSFFS